MVQSSSEESAYMNHPPALHLGTRTQVLGSKGTFSSLQKVRSFIPVFGEFSVNLRERSGIIPDDVSLFTVTEEKEIDICLRNFGS